MPASMRRALRIASRVTVVLLGTWLFGCAALAVAIHHAGTKDEAAPADVIIVLGAALTRTGEPYKALTRRSEHAADLWKQRLAGTVICTGGVGEHVVTRRSEADGCREILLRAGVSRDAIVLEETSRNTEGNAVNSRDIMVHRGLARAILVSDRYHMFRAGRLFRRVGIDAVPSPAPGADVGPAFYVLSVGRELAALHRHAALAARAWLTRARGAPPAVQDVANSSRTAVP